MKRPHFLFVGLEEIGASTQKHQSPIVKHPDAGAEQQRFPDIMGDEQRRLAEPIAQVEELLLQFHTSHRIKRAKGSSNSNNGGSAASARATPTR